MPYFERSIFQKCLWCRPAPLRAFFAQWFHEECSSAVKDAARMAKNTSTGVSLKTAASQLDACFSGRCFTSVNSTAARRPLGARQSNSLAKIPLNLPKLLSSMKTISQVWLPKERFPSWRSASQACDWCDPDTGVLAGLGANCGGSLVWMRSGSINFPQDDRGQGGIKFCRCSPSIA